MGYFQYITSANIYAERQGAGQRGAPGEDLRVQDWRERQADVTVATDYVFCNFNMMKYHFLESW